MLVPRIGLIDGLCNYAPFCVCVSCWMCVDGIVHYGFGLDFASHPLYKLYNPVLFSKRPIFYEKTLIVG